MVDREGGENKRAMKEGNNKYNVREMVTATSFVLGYLLKNITWR